MNKGNALDSIFKDLKIIELASVLAGPAVGMFFAELGADVIKIENRSRGGDMTRSWKLPSEDKETQVSAYFSSVNYKKEYLSIDLSDLIERDQVYKLIENADILICNFKRGSDKKLGMDYSILSKKNPKLIYASIEGFTSNPNKVAFDMVLQAETGFMGMNGYPNQLPAKLPVALIDILAAHQLKEAILIALIQRSKSNEGCLVSVSLEEAALSSLANQASNYLMEGFVPQRIGSLHPNIAPYGEIFQTKDGKQIVVAIGTNGQFKSLCSILNCKELIEDKRFLKNTDRVENRKALKSILDPFFSKVELSKLLSFCEKDKIPIGEIKNLKQVMENPVAQEMILEEKIEGKDTKRLRTVAFHMR